MRVRSACLLAASLSAIAAAPARGETDEAPLHGFPSADILVTAPFERDRLEAPSATTVLEGVALQRELRPTLGEALARQPGVSSTFYGPGASRPILRGLQGERVRVLTDGIGAFDASNTSVDHAVTINPFRASRIEVLRGPAALLYGSSAIGGVVNLLDRRLLRELPDEAFHIDALGFYGSAARERGGAGMLAVPIGASGVSLTADGSFLRAGDYRTGGFVFAQPIREEALEDGEDPETVNRRGRVPNTDARTWEAAAGLSWVGPRGGSLGVSISRFETNYGIPNVLDDEHDHDHDNDHDHDHDHDHHHHHAHEDIRIDMRQTRVDAQATMPLAGAFDRLKVRFGYADYIHDELDDDGDIESTFTNRAFESRAELVQTERNGWRGATGVQFLHRKFNSFGEEAYIPLNLTDQLGLFTLQSVNLGGPVVEVGGRYENSRVRAPLEGISRRFDAFSGSAGVTVPLVAGLRLGGSLAYSERAPSAEELLSDGPHFATRAFELGDPDLSKERSLGAEAVLRGRGDGWRLELSGFFNRFYNYIYLAPTGGMDEGLPIFAYLQSGARLFGFEADASVTVARFGMSRVNLTGLVDYVRADLLGGNGPAPRTPPLRALGGIELDGEVFGARAEVEHVTRQTRIAAFETETPAHTLVNASISWSPLGPATTFVASVNNIFDVEARRHASFIKDFAPLPGRDVRVSARISF